MRNDKGKSIMVARWESMRERERERERRRDQLNKESRVSDPLI
jgi:hypothetical protein